MSVRPIFAWYDFWIGAFYDRKKRRLYVFPVPMVGFYVEFNRAALSTHESSAARDASLAKAEASPNA